MGGGVAVGDINGDGYEDIFFATMSSFIPHESREYSSALYRNMGNGTFENITEEVGLDNIHGYPMGALFFDFNNNGLQDLYVAAFDGGQLFENRGGYFVDVTEEAGLSLEGLCGELPCMAAAPSATDYNKNGYLDLLIVNNVSWDINDELGYGLRAILPFNYKAQSVLLFRNNGDGTFSNVSEESGVTNFDTFGQGNDGKGLSAVWTDVNNNGWADVYIANDTTPSRLYVNNQDGTFRDISIAANLAEFKSSMGIDTADFNNNGLLDLVTTNLEGDMVSLFRNYGYYRFDHVTTSTGLIPSGWGSGWGVLFADLDFDGHQDLVIANGALLEAIHKEKENENIFFRNDGNGRFRNVSDEVVQFSNNEYSRGMALIDVKNNGLPDLVISNINGSKPQLLINRTENSNNRIRLNLEGGKSNRDAIGTRVYVEREDGLIMNQIVKAGNSYQSTSSKSLFFGLGETGISELRIQWPSGRTDVFSDVPVNRIIHITEAAEDDEQSTLDIRDFNVM
nr:CRTAC1 family protein [Rhodohalobacter sp. SW132]